MNILPVVLSLIMILGMASYLFVQGRVATIWEERSFEGYIKAERKLRNEWEKMAFKEAPKKTKDKNSNQTKKEDRETSEPSTEAVYQSPREKKIPSDLSKLNIGPLLKKPSPVFSNRLHEVAAKLIRELYAEQPCFKLSPIKHPEYFLLDGIVEKGKQDDQLDTLVELFPSLSTIKTLFYTLLKGTNTYDLNAPKGIPPLGDFFFVDRTVDVKPIYFPFASKPLLKALVGEKNTLAIFKKEKEKCEENHKHQPLTKSEFEEILLANSQERIDMLDLEDLINFSKSGYSSKLLTGEDTTTGICLKKQFH
jgi:hypothetical protein